MTSADSAGAPASETPKRIYSADITADNGVTGRCLRAWIARGRFPAPDGNLNGRNFWLTATYKRWQADVLNGRYANHRRPGSVHAA
jgi:hypothetical protein